VLLHDVTHNDVILLPAIRRVSDNDFVPAGQCTSTPRRARATVELLHQEMPNFLASNLWPQNSPDRCSVDYRTRSGLLCSIVSTTDKFIVWMNWNGGSSISGVVLNSRFLTRLVNGNDVVINACTSTTSTSCTPTSGEEDFWACVYVYAKGGHFQHSLWTDNVDFVHICYNQCDLFDCYICNYEIIPAMLANTFLFILQGS